MKEKHFFVKLISSLFILVFGLLCLTTTVFLFVRNMTTKNNITYYVKSASIFDSSSLDVISNKQNSTLRQTIKTEMINIDIPALVVDEVIDSQELDTLISDYIYDYSQYILYNSNKPIFPSQDVLNILIEKYKTHEGKDLSEKQKERTMNYIKLLGNKIDQGVLEKNEIDEMISLNIIKKISIIFSNKFMPLILGIIIISLIAIISVCLSSILKAINWCSKITVLNGIILIIASFVEVRVLIMYFNSQGLIDSLVISIVENGFKNMLTYGIILIVLGIIFMIISVLLLKQEKNNKPDIPIESENDKKAITIGENQLNNLITTDNNEIINEDNKQNESNELVEKDNNKAKIKENEIMQKLEDEPKATIIDSQPKDVITNIEDNVHHSEEKEEFNKTNNNVITEDNIQDEVKIVPVVEEKEDKNENTEEEVSTEIEIEEPIKSEEDEPEPENEYDDYSELKDENKEPEIIEKQSIDIQPIKEIKIDVVHPKKGKEIEFESSEEQNDEEEIEVL